MNSEASRLETFDNWIGTAAKWARKIARAGFFLSADDKMLECFSCHIKIRAWTFGIADQIMTKHKLLSPQCLVVVNPLASGNIPLTTEYSESNPSTENFKDEAIRLSTFTCWPKADIISPESLSKSGFYSLKWEDHTQCAFCEAVFVDWKYGDEPDIKHKCRSPDCSFVQSVINRRLGEETDNLAQISNLQVVCTDNFHDLGVQEHKAPKNPKYITYESRLQTFSNWSGDKTQTPESLANAGFYYEGVGDRVRCFHCDGGLCDWDPQDEPWSQHAQWFPKCNFVHINKVVDFINSFSKPQANEQPTTSLRKRPESSRLSENVKRLLPERSEKNAESATSLHKRQKLQRITDSEVEEYLSSEPATAALNIGLHVGRVKQVIKDRLEETGRPYTRSVALIEATLNLQTKEEDGDDLNQPENSGLSEGISKILTIPLQRVFHELNCNDSTPSPKVDSSMNAEEEAKPTESQTNLRLEEEIRILKEARMCKICMDAEVGIVFQPCGHLITCSTCGVNLQRCPLCRCAIKNTVTTFLS